MMDQSKRLIYDAVATNIDLEVSRAIKCIAAHGRLWYLARSNDANSDVRGIEAN